METKTVKTLFITLTPQNNYPQLSERSEIDCIKAQAFKYSTGYLQVGLDFSKLSFRMTMIEVP